MIFPAELLLNKEDPFGIRVSSFQNSTFGLSLTTFEASPNFWVILLLSKFSKVFEPGSFRSVVITLPFNLQLLRLSRTKLLPDLKIASDVRWPFPRCRWRRCRSCRRRRRSPCTSLWTASARWRDLSSTHPASPVCPDFWRSLVRPPSWWLSLDFEPWLLQQPTWMTVTPVTLVTLTTLVSRRFPDRACFDGGRKLFYWKRKRIIHLFLALISVATSSQTAHLYLPQQMALLGFFYHLMLRRDSNPRRKVAPDWGPLKDILLTELQCWYYCFSFDP